MFTVHLSEILDWRSFYKFLVVFRNAQIGESPKRAQVLKVVFENIFGLGIFAFSKCHYCCDDKESQ